MVEALFCCLLAQQYKVDFMKIVKWSLGIHVSWRITPLLVTIHLNQSGFATNLVESFSLQDRNQTPIATPYCAGVPIKSIAESTEANDSPALKQQKEAYQSLVESISWLAHSTHPDLITAHLFLAFYSNKPSTGHMKAALYAFIIYTLYTIILDPCIPSSFTTSPAGMLRLTTMPPLQNPLIHLPPPPTAMHDGARRLVALWQMALSSLYSNLEV